MIKLGRIEQAAVADIQAAYEKLSPDAQAAVAQGVSWAERHIMPVSMFSLIVGAAAGAAILAFWPS
jgi:hypothetical protein